MEPSFKKLNRHILVILVIQYFGSNSKVLAWCNRNLPHFRIYENFHLNQHYYFKQEEDLNIGTITAVTIRMAIQAGFLAQGGEVAGVAVVEEDVVAGIQETMISVLRLNLAAVAQVQEMMMMVA